MTYDEYINEPGITREERAARKREMFVFNYGYTANGKIDFAVLYGQPTYSVSAPQEEER